MSIETKEPQPIEPVLFRCQATTKDDQRISLTHKSSSSYSSISSANTLYLIIAQTRHHLCCHCLSGDQVVIAVLMGTDLLHSWLHRSLGWRTLEVRRGISLRPSSAEFLPAPGSAGRLRLLDHPAPSPFDPVSGHGRKGVKRPILG